MAFDARMTTIMHNGRLGKYLGCFSVMRCAHAVKDALFQRSHGSALQPHDGIKRWKVVIVAWVFVAGMVAFVFFVGVAVFFLGLIVSANLFVVLWVCV